MTDMELAYRKAEIKKAQDGIHLGMHSNSNRPACLALRLLDDLVSSGMKYEKAFRLVYGW